MRLLHIQQSGRFNLVDCSGDTIPPYAILSHTWASQDEEVSFQDLQTKSGENKKGYRKLSFCGIQAAKDGFDYFWVDTCCIDKTSSAELSEAINSMYTWYQAAKVCYAYLADVASITTLPKSRWFTRGWTLQELIAPADLVFFSQEWERLGTKLELSRAINECSGIPTAVLHENKNLESFSVAQKMSWAAHRQTTRVEDGAYCLMGMFGINMPLIYGEGGNAFFRLQEEIIKVSDDHSLFAWQSQDARGGCLATSPSSFQDCANVVQIDHVDTFYDPPSISSRAVQIELRFIGCRPGRRGFAILNCCQEGSEDEPLAIHVQDLSRSMKRFERIDSDTLTRVNLRSTDPSWYSVKKLSVRGGRLNGQNVGQRALNTIPPPDLIQSGLTLSPMMDTSDAFFEALELATEDDIWLLLTRANIRINMQNKKGQTALSYAVSKGFEYPARMLLGQSDIDVNLADNQGRTPLSCAAASGELETVRLLLDDFRAVRNTKDIDGRTPLSWAAGNGHYGIVELLLRTESVHVNVEDEDGWTPLAWAVRSGQDKTSRLLIKISRQMDERKLFYEALRYGRVGVVRLLLELDADIEAKDREGFTMLMRAASHDRDLGIALLLIEHGADVNTATINGRRPLHEASKIGHLRMAEALLDRNADLQVFDDDMRTPLHEAAGHGKADVAFLLLEKGADAQAKDRHGWTALVGAIDNGHEALIQKLIECGADVNATAKNGWNPMMEAMKYEDLYLQRLLRVHGALEVNEEDAPRVTKTRLTTQ